MTNTQETKVYQVHHFLFDFENIRCSEFILEKKDNEKIWNDEKKCEYEASQLFSKKFDEEDVNIVKINRKN